MRTTAFSLAGVVATIVLSACGGGSNGESGFQSILDASIGQGDDATLPSPDSGPTPVLAPGKDHGTDAGTVALACPDPLTCLSLGYTCGAAGDGCGNTIQCGTCTPPQGCGAGGTPSVCGDSTPCVPKTCTDLSATCGQQGDGCGNVIQCGTCTLPQTCGGGGTFNACGAAVQAADAGPPPSCTPLTCATANANCGQVADGCGGLTADCGGCVAPSICGGGGVANQCGDSNDDGGAGACTNLCLQIPTCAAGVTTSISGTVVAPTPPQYGTPDPLYGAVVYIPNSPGGALDDFPNGVSCDQCGAQASGQPLVTFTTGPNGQFKLTGVPAGANIPVVYQLGRWRREVFVNVTACQDNPLTLDQTRFPRKQHEFTPYDNIPLTALVTGSVDALECVLRKIGIDDTQVGDPTTPAYGATSPRLQLYLGSPTNSGADNGAASGVSYDSKTPKESVLWTSAANIEQYDQVLLACQGGADTRTAKALAAMEAYANVGGRVYATHYSYDWIFTNDTWKTTADWSQADQPNIPPNTVTATVDQGFADGQAFAQWLVYAGASAVAGSVPISVSRHDVFPPFANGGEEWLYATQPDTDTPLHYTFDTPVGTPPAQQCGRVLYSDFHVTDSQTTSSTRYPNECSTGKMTSQEKVLEFNIFNLASCIQGNPPPPPPTCTSKSCVDQNIACGPAGDGCGNIIQCGNCAAGTACGAGGASQCGPVANPCTPNVCPACTDAGVCPCGPEGDGCGGLLQCGTCPAGQTCGGGGVANQCGAPPCVPAACAASQNCGIIADGCGGSVNCGTCVTPDTCGGGGIANQCGNEGPR
jgi:hypothetical protein